MRIALHQLNSSREPAENLADLERRAFDSADVGAHLVVFPEAMMRRFGRSIASVAEALDGPWANGVRAVARRADITIVAGMFTIAADGRVHNTLLITGKTVDTYYHKQHLYDAFGFRESTTIAPGDTAVTADVDGVRVGFATCYDLRFPELFVTLARQGAALIVVPASWASREEPARQWRLLVRARALDSTSFVAACNQALPSIDPNSGTGPTGTLGCGHTALVDPRGEVMSELGATPGVLVSDIDLEQVAEIRERLPVIAQRE